MITLGIEDYLWMKQTHLIVDGKVDTLAVRFASEKIGKTLSKYHVADTYAFFWAGWCERMIENTGIQIDPTLIYQKLEPELWKTLIKKQEQLRERILTRFIQLARSKYDDGQQRHGGLLSTKSNLIYGRNGGD